MNYKTIVQELISAIPEFTLSKEFKTLDDFELTLSYVVFGVFSDWYIDLIKEKDKKLIDKTSNFLERMATNKGNKVVTLLWFGFLENISDLDPHYEEIVATFGPATKDALRKTEAHNRKIAERQREILRDPEKYLRERQNKKIK